MNEQRRLRMPILLATILFLSALAGCRIDPDSVDTLPPPTATPTPAVLPLPDPRTDPLGALQASSESDLPQSMGFTMMMTGTVQPADDASATALGDDVVARLEGQDTRISIKGVVEITDKTADQFNMQMLYRSYMGGLPDMAEIVLLDGKAWVRDRFDDDAWTEVDAEIAQDAFSGGLTGMGMEELYKSAIDVEYVGQEARHGQSMHHLRFTLDPQTTDLGAVFGDVGVQAEQVEQFMEDASINVNAWLGTDDLILRYLDIKQAYNLPGTLVDVSDANLRLLMNITTAYTNINEPVTIKAPLPAAPLQPTPMSTETSTPAPADIPTSLSTDAWGPSPSVGSSFDCKLVIGIPQEECEVLVTLFVSTDGENWRDNTGWLTLDSACLWVGVTCADGHVTRLSLPGNQLSGSIPPELGKLASLEYLWLAGNELSANIPPELGNMASLEYLWLYRNKLSGSIPPELGNLTNLRQLRLQANELSGSIPARLCDIPDLIIDLQDTQLEPCQ